MESEGRMKNKQTVSMSPLEERVSKKQALMADASISMVLNRLAPIIEKKVREEVCLLLNANDEAEKLASKLKKIQEVLMDAEQKGVMDRKVKSWLDKLQDISYDIDEVLDEWDLDILKRQLEESDEASGSSDSLLQKVSSCLQSICLCFRTSVERRTVAKEIKKLSERLDLIAQENENEFKFIPNLSPESQDFRRVITSSIVDVSEVQGRDHDLRLLMKKLLPESGSVGNEGIRIVSIVGTGGMGKTTLAQLAFNHDRMMDHFQVKIWVCVSHPFNEIKIAKAILEAVDGNSPNLSQLETLLQSIKNSISGKRFLLVLDDVWIVDDTMWKPLRSSLTKKGAPGSRILVTTRNTKVAEIMGSTQIQLLDPLSDSYCWSILSQIAFLGRNEGDCEMLKEIGWEIALKCKGMPLAAKTLGSLLRFKSSLQEWKNVLKNKVWEMDEVRTNIFPFLALSYNELHPAVKRCFSYCAVFPKDCLIDVDDLIRIWMAQGFLYSSGTSGEIELKGKEYFEDLAMRSFFQDFERGGVEDNRVKWCKMHDLVHDFAQSLTNNECLIAENDEVRWDKNTRHLNLLESEAKTSMDLFMHCQTEKLCSFMCRKMIPQNLFSHLKRIKLLNLSDCNLKDVPREIGNLIHLRYLNLRTNFSLKKLPESICDLCNLQTLNLSNCSSLSGLPVGVHKLVNLRHLLVSGTSVQFEFTQGLEKLVNLQTLDNFVSLRGSDNKLGYLKDLNLLGGYLEIRIFDLDDAYDNVVEAEKADLKNKTFLQHLALLCDEVGVRVMNALQPSPNLRRLDFAGSYLPNWITSLINLRELQILGGGHELEVLHSLRKLPFLERLTLSDLEVEHLSPEFVGLSTTATRKPPSAFPKLKYLFLHACESLTEWDDIGEEDEADTIISILPCLHRLEISNCWELKALPHRLMRKAASSLQILEINNCEYLLERYREGSGEDWDKIAHIPHTHIV